MYPSCFIPATHDARGDVAEEAVYNALRDMPDAKDWIVLHNYRRTQFVPNQDRPWENYEADFIVITPDRGYIVLEVKNWHDFIPSSQADGNTWQLRLADGARVFKKSPASQVDDAKRYITSLLVRAGVVPDERLQKQNSYRQGRGFFKMVENRAAVVMFAQKRHELNSLFGGEDATYICSDELDPQQLKERLLGYFVHEKRQQYQYSPLDILHALLPAMEFHMSFEQWTAFMERAAAPINELFPMLENSTADILVEGCAGSGKTVLASREARRLAERYPDRKVLFLCYNGFLAAHMLYQSGIKDADGAPGNLEVMTLNELCCKLTGRADFFCERDLTFSAVKELLAHELPTYDYIFVDEGQDFRREWWPLITAMRRARLHVLMDGNQNLYDRAGGKARNTLRLPIHIKLRKNLRNTDKITRFSRGVLPAEGEIEPLGITLCEEVCVEAAAASPQERAKTVRSLIKSLKKTGAQPSDIVVLSPWTEQNEKSSLAFLKSEIDCRRMVGDRPERPREHFERWMKARRRGEAGVFGETIKGFKGLEARYVILTDIGTPSSGADETGFSENDFYVGCTRAQFRLMIVPSDDFASMVLQSTSERKE